MNIWKNNRSKLSHCNANLFYLLDSDKDEDIYHLWVKKRRVELPGTVTLLPSAPTRTSIFILLMGWLGGLTLTLHPGPSTSSLSGSTWCQRYKTFFLLLWRWGQISRAFVLGKPFEPNLTPRAWPRVEGLKSSSGRLWRYSQSLD